LIHYVVISGEMSTGGFGYEPPEWWRDVTTVLTRTRRQAKWQAVKSDDFADWRAWQNDGHSFPTAGLTVELARCSHDVCWECTDSCSECEPNVDAEWLRQ
jgi:hypothetical protein